MSTARGRTAAAAVLAAAVGARIAASAPLDASSARIAADPRAALRHAADGWSAAGSLGNTSAYGLREVPLAVVHWLGSEAGLSAGVLSTGLRVLVMVLALLGALRVARAVSPDSATHDSWAPWASALLYVCGPALAAATVRSPVDGLAVAAMPWAIAPILERRRGWGPAAATAVWVGIAGMAGPVWAVAVLLVVVGAGALATQRTTLQSLRVVLTTLVASVWWVWALAWEVAHASDVSAVLVPSSVPAGLAEALEWPGVGTPWLVVAAAAPALVVVAALFLRAPGLPALGPVLVVAGSLGIVLCGAGWVAIPVAAGPVGVVPATLSPALAWLSLAGLLAGPPVMSHLHEGLRTRTVPTRRLTPRGTLLSGLAVLLVLAAGTSVIAAVQERQPSEPAAAGTWDEVAAWSATAPAGRVLVVPARAGRDSSTLAGALSGRPWVSRSSVPTSGAGATTAVDDVIGRLARGNGDEGTADALRRLGVSYVLLREDGGLAQDRSRPSGLVRAALEEQGATRTAVLGIEGADHRLLDQGVRSSTPQVEIWKLDGSAGARLYEGVPLTVAGDPSAVADLAAAGVSRSRALQLVPGGARVDTELVSDSARRRQVDQRLAVDPLGRDLLVDAPRRVVPATLSAATTAVRALAGAQSVSASSSSADLGTPDTRAGSDAVSAVDANPYTAWVSAPGDTTQAWWDLSLGSPTDLSSATVQFTGNRVTGFPVARVRVETDREKVDRDVPEGGLLTLGLTEPAADLRITVTEVTPTTDEDDRVGIVDVTAPGLAVESRHVVAGTPTSGWVLATRPDGRDGCVPAIGSVVERPREVATVCAAGLAVEGPDSGAMRRTITAEEATVVDGSVWMRAVGTEPAAALADRLAAPTVTATGSSVVAADLDVRPQSAADGDPRTAWRPSTADAQPTLTLAWRHRREISGLRLVVPDDTLWSTPTRVRIDAVDVEGVPYSEQATVAEDGSVDLPLLRTRSLTVTVVADSGVVSGDSYAGGEGRVPVAIAEVALVGGPRNEYDADRRETLACGSGPTVTVAGGEVDTRLTVSAREVVEGRLVRARFCSRPELPAGDSLVTATGTFTWTPLGLLLRRSTAGSAGSGPLIGAYDPLPADLSVTSLTDPLDARTIPVGGGGTHVLTLAVRADDGWIAWAGGEQLAAITVDGWAQGWRVPAGTTELTFRYSADGLLPGVGSGAVGWVLVLIVALLAGRREGTKPRP